MATRPGVQTKWNNSDSFDILPIVTHTIRSASYTRTHLGVWYFGVRRSRVEVGQATSRRLQLCFDKWVLRVAGLH